MEEIFDQTTYSPNYESPLEESAAAHAIEQIKQDPRRRAIINLENENLYALKLMASAKATMQRNTRLRRQIERKLMADIGSPVIHSFVPDLAPRRTATALAAAVVLGCLVGAAGYVATRATSVEPALASETAVVAVKAVEAVPTPAPAAAPEAVKQPQSVGKASKPSQEQKDATASVCDRVAANRRDLYEAANISVNQFKTTCYYDLLAMAWHESHFDCKAVGDGGKSRGCFQIQTAMHGLTVAQAEDYAFAAEWTLDRMVRDTGYPRYRTASLRRHNGSGDATIGYADSIKAKAAQMESDGL